MTPRFSLVRTRSPASAPDRLPIPTLSERPARAPRHAPFRALLRGEIP